MKNQNIFNELDELNQAELENIFGGESLWYWVAYGVGAVAHSLSEAAHGIGARDQQWVLEHSK